MIRQLTPDIAEIEVEAIEKVISVPTVNPAVPTLTIDTVADSPLPPMTRIGIDAATGADVMVGDRERCGGFYILGQPRTGKSNLLISMALSDIEKGTSILFIDPHTDAITRRWGKEHFQASLSNISMDMLDTPMTSSMTN